jgi:hypothetical protein
VRGVWFASSFALVAGCGGAQEEVRAPHEDRTHEPAAREAESAPEPTPAEEAAPPACADEGCFPCGAGFCPVGFYCDEGASGGPACSWVQDCARKAGCDCVGRALRGSRCESEGGGAHVR